MVWNATRILWDEQVLLLWVILPPVFLFSGLLAVAAPLIFRERKIERSHSEAAAPRHAVADNR